MSSQEKKPPSALVLDNQKLHKENYSLRKTAAKHMFAIAALSIGANIFMLWLIFVHFPVSKFVPTANAAAVCEVVPVSEPFVHHQVAADFAVEAVLGIYTYDHANYRRQLSAITDKYFTSDYRNAFMVSFGDSPNLRAVIDNYYVVSSTTAGRPPEIAETGKYKGAFLWRIKVPIDVYYISGRKNQVEKVLATVDVIRTPPTRLNPRGIAVNQIITAPFVR